VAERLPPPKGALAALVLAGLGAATTITHPFEGNVTHTYPDVVYGWKLPTSCRGHTGLGPDGLPMHAGQEFTQAECDELEHADLTKTFDGLRPCFGDAALVKLNPNQLGAFLSMGYNMGAGAVCRSSIPGKVRAGRLDSACATIGQFVFAGGKDCRDPANHCAGIPRRRAAEQALCERRP